MLWMCSKQHICGGIQPYIYNCNCLVIDNLDIIVVGPLYSVSLSVLYYDRLLLSTMHVY
jgi:hypothetical protein